MRYSFLPLMGLMLFLNSPAGAADLENGAKLHDDNCVSCHTAMTQGKPDSVYTREDRQVKTIDALQAQVQRCTLNLGLKWFDSELEDVAAYLNQNYYHFETESTEK